MKNNHIVLQSVLLLLVSIAFPGYTQENVTSAFYPIHNNTFWDTKDGDPIYSQGGGIFKFKDTETGQQKYYWYGVRYQEAESYRKDPSVTHEHATFESVTCYSSTDLVNWTFENNVLTKTETNTNHKRPWVGRLGVAFIPEIAKYAMFVQHNHQVLVALSDSPTGTFLWDHLIDMTPMIGTSNTGDQTVFTDEDTGKSYLIYSYGRGRNKIYVSEIGLKDGKVGLLDCTEIFRGAGREGNCMFKYQGKYYMAASNLYGWDSSFAYYLVADDIRGPYNSSTEMLVMKGSEADYAHVTQTGFFVTVKGSEKDLVLYCGDRWADFAGNGLGYNQWFPLSFEGTTPYFNSLSAWELDAVRGMWKVGATNNFVKNGSFEADRRYIPSKVKPVQDYLLGWDTRIVKGNQVSVQDSLTSPVLNYFNTQQDRKVVVGEKSLHISDQVDFERIVSQQISSSPFVALADGVYTLSAWIKNTPGFSTLQMFAESKGKRYDLTVDSTNPSWTKITLKQIAVRAGQVEVGFRAIGKAGASCQIDEVRLVRD